MRFLLHFILLISDYQFLSFNLTVISSKLDQFALMQKSLYCGNPISQSGLYVIKSMKAMENCPSAKCLEKVIYLISGSQALVYSMDLMEMVVVGRGCHVQKMKTINMQVMVLCMEDKMQLLPWLFLKIFLFLMLLSMASLVVKLR